MAEQYRVLQAVLNQDALIRSEDLVSELDDTAKTFVPTPTFDLARELLERESVCLLAGIPGIGKSTIAKMLALIQLEKGYQVVDVTREIAEIDKLWLPETPQLFFYDDFLGEIALDHHLAKNEDRRCSGSCVESGRRRGNCWFSPRASTSSGRPSTAMRSWTTATSNH